MPSPTSQERTESGELVPMPETEGINSALKSPRLPPPLPYLPPPHSHTHPTPARAPEQEEEALCVLRATQLVAITHTIKSQRGGQPCPPAAPVWSPCQS